MLDIVISMRILRDMNAATTPLKATVITNLLKKNGYHQSTGSSSRVSGFSTFSEGFTTENESRMEQKQVYKINKGYVPGYVKTYTGNVLVSYTAQTGGTKQSDVTVAKNQIAKVLKDAGYKVSTNFRGELVVTNA